MAIVHCSPKGVTSLKGDRPGREQAKYVVLSRQGREWPTSGRLNEDNLEWLLGSLTEKQRVLVFRGDAFMLTSLDGLQILNLSRLEQLDATESARARNCYSN